MGFYGKILKQRQKTTNTEKLDPKPIAIIEGVQKPDTLIKAIDRILMGRYGPEEFERMRGFQFDITEESEEEANESDTEDSYEDDVGYFYTKKEEEVKNGTNENDEQKTVSHTTSKAEEQEILLEE